MRSGRLSVILLIVYVLSNVQGLVAAVPLPATATCEISCTVANIVEWSEISFPAIDMGSLTAKNKQATGEAILTLYTNGDVTITANNNNSAELSFGPHALLTGYKLEYDGSGIKQTGGRQTAWCPSYTFLKEGADIVHIPTDGSVEIILSVGASIKKIRPENSGRYNAIQILTACWKS